MDRTTLDRSGVLVQEVDVCGGPIDPISEIHFKSPSRNNKTDLGQEALEGRIRCDQVQEGRRGLPEPCRRHADQEGPAVAAADVVGVTDHVVHGDLLGAGLRPLEPVPEGGRGVG